MTADEKLIAFNGGDHDDRYEWILVVPRALDLKACLAEYKEWYRMSRNTRNFFFEEWLKRKGAREPTVEEVEFFKVC